MRRSRERDWKCVLDFGFAACIYREEGPGFIRLFGWWVSRHYIRSGLAMVYTRAYMFRDR